MCEGIIDIRQDKLYFFSERYGELTERLHTEYSFIKNSDWIIDLGPEGGDKGGEIVAEGTPKHISTIKKSYTGKYLK